jgi:hypothetical protein
MESYALPMLQIFADISKECRAVVISAKPPFFLKLSFPKM